MKSKGKRKERIAAVVVTFNRRELLRECLTALNKQTRKLDEIIVIDNASTDGTNQLVPKEFPQVTYIRLSENTGGAGGFYRGVKHAYEAGYDRIWIMDDDAIAYPTALAELMRHAKNDTEVLASIVEQPTGIFSAYRVPQSFLDAVRFGLHVPVKDTKKRIVLADLLPFVGPLLPRKIVEAVGLPNPDFFIYFDDTDYCLRIRSHGFSIKLVQQSRIEHRLGFKKSSPQLWRYAYYWRNYFAILRMHADQFSLGVLMGIYLRSVLSLSVSVIGRLVQPQHSIGGAWCILHAAYNGLAYRLGKLSMR